jgi:hypothetical protein
MYDDWRDFWLAPQAVEPLVVARVGLGLSMLCAYLLYTPFIERLFGADGLGAYLLGHDFYIRDHAWFTYWMVVISAAAFTLGCFTKVAGLTLILGHLTFIEPGHAFSWGWTPTVPAFLWYLTWGPSNAAYSVDAWAKKRFFGLSPVTKPSGWCLRIIQFHIIAIYIGASYHRLDDRAWWHGEMVFDAMAYAYYTRFPNLALMPFKPLMELSNYSVWFLELSAPFGLVYARTRLWYALGLWFMHLGLELTSTIGWWQFMMMSVLFVYFPHHWSEKVLRLFVRPAPGRVFGNVSTGSS